MFYLCSGIENKDTCVESNKATDNEFERGTACLKYISPEHTGRVNIKPDQRSDMYSFGKCPPLSFLLLFPIFILL